MESVNDISATTADINDVINNQFDMIKSVNDNMQSMSVGVEENVQILDNVVVTVQRMQARTETLRKSLVKFKV
ncbi:hypothetical protein AGMMS49941_13460 [Deferribacterales bacterium]|nr:hypothetical protein AGMMS49941_13460 [Deferribacterales bacterium]